MINSIQNKDAPLEVMKGWQLEEISTGNITEIAYNSLSSDGYFVIGTDNKQVINITLDTKDKNNEE